MKRQYKVVILGGGTGGIASANRLLKKDKSLKNDILIIERESHHYFQPGWPLVGSGEMKLKETWKATEDVIPKGIDWIQESVEEVDPIKREVGTDERTVQYDFLIIALGLELDYNAIKGAPESLGKNGVCTNYLYNHVEYTFECLQKVEEGNIVISKPVSEIKGGVSAENSLFTMNDYIRRRNRNVGLVFRSGRKELFPVAKYNDNLIDQFNEKNIDYKLNSELISVDGEGKQAIFRDRLTGEHHEVPFEMLIITPPMHGPSILQDTELLNPEGWVDVDPYTLMHNKYTTVFSLGDASSLPTVKMGAAVKEQVPILVDNLLERMQDEAPSHYYDGKTACPIATGYGELIMAEFGYDLLPKETTFLDQSDNKRVFYKFKKDMLPFMYWHALLKGRI